MENPLKDEFEKWFSGLLLDTSRNKSCFWRDVLRGCKEHLYQEFLRLNFGGEATLQAISSKSDEMIRAASMAAKERRALKASIYTCDED